VLCLQIFQGFSLRWIWESQRDVYKECYLLGCEAPQYIISPTFRKNILVLSAVWMSKLCKKQVESRASFYALFTLITLQSWRWRQYSSPKRRWTSTRLHGVTFQKIVFSSFVDQKTFVSGTVFGHPSPFCCVVKAGVRTVDKCRPFSGIPYCKLLPEVFQQIIWSQHFSSSAF
jgi:hypothetical protein